VPGAKLEEVQMQVVEGQARFVSEGVPWRPVLVGDVGSNFVCARGVGPVGQVVELKGWRAEWVPRCY
jgi:hypothetical protein